MPPWINKYYVLDLTPEKSFIKWCVDQGITVFCISWVNPDAAPRPKKLGRAYREGPLAALDAIKLATGEDRVHTVGYCVGGTLLAIALAAMATQQDERIVSATMFAAQVDFTYAGDLKVFVDPDQLKVVEQRMAERGYLEGNSMVTVFNLLRSNDLIWPYIINNYVKGKTHLSVRSVVLEFRTPPGCRRPTHSFYLRNCYLDEQAHQGRDHDRRHADRPRRVKIPIYNLATREDHIAPAKSVLLGSKYFGGPVRFVLSGSGHIAGVVNPPDKHNYQYWTGPKPRSANLKAD